LVATFNPNWYPCNAGTLNWRIAGFLVKKTVNSSDHPGQELFVIAAFVILLLLLLLLLLIIIIVVVVPGGSCPWGKSAGA
jgi:hypothetical protein